MNLFAAGIVSISCYFHQPLRFRRPLCGSWWGLHLLGGSQVSERFGTTENQHESADSRVDLTCTVS